MFLPDYFKDKIYLLHQCYHHFRTLRNSMFKVCLNKKTNGGQGSNDCISNCVANM